MYATECGVVRYLWCEVECCGEWISYLNESDAFTFVIARMCVYFACVCVRISMLGCVISPVLQEVTQWYS